MNERKRADCQYVNKSIRSDYRISGTFNWSKLKYEKLFLISNE